MEHGFSWIGTIPGLRDLPNHSVTATLVAIILVGVAWAMLQLNGSETPSGLTRIRENVFQLSYKVSFCSFPLAQKTPIWGLPER